MLYFYFFKDFRCSVRQSLLSSLLLFASFKSYSKIISIYCFNICFCDWPIKNMAILIINSNKMLLFIGKDYWTYQLSDAWFCDCDALFSFFFFTTFHLQSDTTTTRKHHFDTISISFIYFAQFFAKCVCCPLWNMNENMFLHLLWLYLGSEGYCFQLWEFKSRQEYLGQLQS